MYFFLDTQNILQVDFRNNLYFISRARVYSSFIDRILSEKGGIMSNPTALRFS